MTSNIADKVWTILQSFDGYDSLYLAGDKPSGYQTAPTLLNTDIVSGSPTGFEGTGCYITVLGYSFGTPLNMGRAAGVKVYFRNPAGDNAWHECGGYRYLTKARTWARNQKMALGIVLGTCSGQATAGAVLDMKLTVNGVDSNILTSYFTVQVGRCFYVDNVNGNDATGVPDDITKPFQNPQVFVSGTTYTGLCAVTTAMGDPGLRAGDTVCFRDRGTAYNSQLGYDGRFFRFRHTQHNGSAPNGTVGNGFIHFTSYPGLGVVVQAPETMHYVDPSGGKGGFHGANSAWAGTTGTYWSVSNVHGELSSTTVSDGAFINLQNGADNTRFVHNEVGPWPSSVAAPNDPRAGGIAGQGIGVVVWDNYVHDIYGDPTALQNHGIYIGSGAQGTGVTAKNWDVAYNWVYNSAGGSSLQWNNTNASDNWFSGFKIHHNWFEGNAKYGINFASGMSSADVWNNVVIGSGIAPVRFDNNPNITLINVVHNTFVQSATSGAYTGMIQQTAGGLTAGTVNVKHNIFYMKAGHSASLSFTNLGAGDTAVSMLENNWYDADGINTTMPTKDTSAVTGNPLFTSIANSDYTLQSGSVARGAGTLAEAIAVNDDYYGWPRPVTGTGSPGGTKNDIGAMQGVGT